MSYGATIKSTRPTMRNWINNNGIAYLLLSIFLFSCTPVDIALFGDITDEDRFHRLSQLDDYALCYWHNHMSTDFGDGILANGLLSDKQVAQNNNTVLILQRVLKNRQIYACQSEFGYHAISAIPEGANSNKFRKSITNTTVYKYDFPNLVSASVHESASDFNNPAPSTIENVSLNENNLTNVSTNVGSPIQTDSDIRRVGVCKTIEFGLLDHYERKYLENDQTVFGSIHSMEEGDVSCVNYIKCEVMADRDCSSFEAKLGVPNIDMNIRLEDGPFGLIWGDSVNNLELPIISEVDATTELRVHSTAYYCAQEFGNWLKPPQNWNIWTLRQPETGINQFENLYTLAGKNEQNIKIVIASANILGKSRELCLYYFNDGLYQISIDNGEFDSEEGKAVEIALSEKYLKGGELTSIPNTADIRIGLQQGTISTGNFINVNTWFDVDSSIGIDRTVSLAGGITYVFYPLKKLEVDFLSDVSRSAMRENIDSADF
jgi:hypothetical protein